jgi:hypothetical protein
MQRENSKIGFELICKMQKTALAEFAIWTNDF